jgi:hypothetical protein
VAKFERNPYRQQTKARHGEQGSTSADRRSRRTSTPYRVARPLLSNGGSRARERDNRRRSSG